MIRYNNLFKEKKEDEIDPNALNAPGGAGNFDTGGSGTGGENKHGDENSKGNDDDDEFQPDERWETLKTFLPDDKKEDFKVPEDVTKDNEEEKLKDAYKKVLVGESDGDQNGNQKPEGVSPIAYLLQQEMQDKGENFNISEWANTVAKASDVESIKKQSADELIAEKYYAKYGKKSEDNPDGLEQSDVEEELKNMTKISKRELGEEIRNEKLKNAEKFQGTMEYQKPEPVTEDQVQSQLDKILSELQKDEKPITLAGLDISKAIQENKSEIVKQLTPGEKGYAPIDEALQSDPSLSMTIAFLNTDKGKTFVKDMFSEENMDLRLRDFIEKLDKEGTTNFKFQQQKKEKNAVDLSRLNDPDYGSNNR